MVYDVNIFFVLSCLICHCYVVGVTNHDVLSVAGVDIMLLLC